MEDTDNFAYIIGEMRRKEDEIRRTREEWARWREGSRCDVSGTCVIVMIFLTALAAIGYFFP